MSGTLQTVINNLKVSQQYLDRVGPGLQGDQIVQQDQTAQLNRLLNIKAYTLLGSSSVGTAQYADAARRPRSTARPSPTTVRRLQRLRSRFRPQTAPSLTRLPS